ncbi:ImmA/IrrE family metallo-endopeptidase [Microbacterium sp. 2RAF4]|uniref:ImmA/IrrE family metallo-endopeptidase n=1 Tax=Microbacterium sp. 2RAF4 TaxID=3232999 RepID=UPI003F98628E
MSSILDAIEYEGHIEAPMSSTAFMFGVNGFEDGPCAYDYDPWVHAEILDLPIVFRDDLPDVDMVACYSQEHEAVFVRTNLHAATERCAIAHEIVHFEHQDVGTDDLQEERADRIAARRLVRPRRIEELSGVTDDPAVVALELNVTEKIMRVYMRLIRQGRISRYA